MPNMADITVKKNDGTTDILYTAAGAAGSDGVAATWRSMTVGTAMAHQPDFRFWTKDGSQGANRVSRGTFAYPMIATNSTTGVTSVIAKMTMSVDATMPKSMTQADINEAVAQFANLLKSTLIQSSLKAGLAPT